MFAKRNILSTFLIVAAAAVLLGPVKSMGQAVVQTYFVPFDENEVNVALNTIDEFDGNIGSEIRSLISIVGGVTNTVLYWDHWEDGYEADITSPTQTTTRIWGDNNPANGIPPGYASDVVGEGDIVTLNSDIAIPRDPSVIAYDASDRLSVTRWVALSRYIYAPNPGEVLAGSAQVYDRSKFGFVFRAPVGINTGTNQMFEYSSMLIQAGYDATVVQIDTDADGITDETVFMDKGEDHVVRFTSEGATVTASKPVQCHMITGDMGSNYEMRVFELFPESAWDTSYFISVSSIDLNNPTEVFLFNPNTNDLSIVAQTLVGTTSVLVPPNVTRSFVMPRYSGGHLYTTNGQTFIPVAATDTRQTSSGNQAHDWGHSLVPVKSLTSVSIVPWAPGSGGNPISVNGNPIWVTPESNTTLFVDWDGDSSTGPLIDPYGRRYDFTTNLVGLQSLRLYDPTDNDQTGMRIYTTNSVRFATTWGQDPAIAPPGNPYLDMGAAVFPFPTVPAVKNWELTRDLNTNGVVNPGEDVTFTIYVENVGFVDANDVIVYDIGAQYTTYNTNSTYVNGSNVVDDVVPPFGTPFPLDEGGLNIGILPVGQTATVSYVVTIDNPFPTNVDGIVNGVYVDNLTQVFVPIPIPGFNMTKTSTPTNPVNIGDTISYQLDIENTGNVYQTGIQIIDQLPDTVTWVPGSTYITVSGQFDGSFFDDFHVIDEYNGSDGALVWGSDWLEAGEGDGPGSGDIQVLADGGAVGDVYMLQIQNSNQGAYRLADLGQYTNATLTFDYRRESFEGGEAMYVQASVNGGGSWTTIRTIGGTGTDAAYFELTNNLTPYIDSNFALRFIGNGTMSSGDRVYIDNVEIAVSGYNTTNAGFAPDTIVQGYALDSNQTMRVNFDVTVDPDIAVSNVVNVAYITSFNSPAPFEASVTNRVLLPARSTIAGYVRNDTDGDGDLNDPDAGINGVSITLFTDPNGDGNPSDGLPIASTFSGTNGYYELGNFLSNNYVVLETDPINFLSTADSDGGSPNRISFTTISGIGFTNNIFLDTQRAAISGEVRYDEDADGDISDADGGIDAVTVRLYTDPNGDGDESDGTLVESTTTDSDGIFTFSSVTTGRFVVVEADPIGLISTADSFGANDNRVVVFMFGGIDSIGHVFLDSSSGLRITKESSPPGIWFPNLQARYLITVANTGLYTHTGVDVNDILGTGLTYTVNSAFITATVVASNNVSDTFPTDTYTNNTGDANWSTDWVESDGGGGGPASGGIFVTDGELNIGDLVTGQPSVTREVDLSGASSATLTFEYDTTGGVEDSDEITLSASTNGTTWDTINVFAGEISGSAEYDISSYISPATRIRFQTTLNYNGADEYFMVDDVQIYWENESLVTVTGAPPVTMAGGYTLTPGNEISIVFTAEVGSVDSVINTACVTSDIETNGICDSVVNSVDTSASPDRISGQVRFDADGDGDLADPDFGIQAVAIDLYTDPNADGNPGDGVLVDSTTTDLDGYYIFGELTNGNYVVVENDPSGYLSTGDASGTNDNWVAAFLPGGVDSRDNDFLDRTVSGLTIDKFSDKPDVVVPGELMTYSIIVSNTRVTTATGVNIYDNLPPGLEFISNSSCMKVSGQTVSNTVQDRVDSVSYGNNDGTANWTGNWIESSDDGSPFGGDLLIESDLSANRLRVRDDGNSIQRSADLSGSSYATLSLYYRRQGLEAGEYVALEIATSPSGPWTELASYAYDGGSSTTDGSYQYDEFDIFGYASSNTTIRFRSPSGGMSNGDIVYFDDITLVYGYTQSLITNSLPPPLMVSNLTLTANSYVSIVFTSEVSLAADYLVNTGIVYTSTDTNGLRTYASNFVGQIVMTQGLVVVEGGGMGVRVGWSAYTDDDGDVTKDYDILCVDDDNLGFHPGLTSGWSWVSTLKHSILVDTGGHDRVSPVELGNKMRFYRAAFKDTWSEDKPTRFATREVYVAKCVHLAEGENFISLFMLPDVNTIAGVMGTNRLPSGSSIDNSTRIEWYNSTPQSEATNVVWLSSAGIWMKAEGGLANHLPLPLNKGFNLITPPGSGDMDLLLVGRVPTNTAPEIGHSSEIVGNESYTILSYNLPYRVTLKDSGLKEAGFAGVPADRYFNPRFSDELRIMKKGGGSLQQPDYRILRDKDGTFKYWTGGSGSAENHVLEVDDALVIYSKMSTSNLQWNVNLPYPEPTLYMTP